MQEKRLERQMELLESQFDRKDFQERIVAEALAKADSMMARQFPVPPAYRRCRLAIRVRSRANARGDALPEGWVEGH